MNALKLSFPSGRRTLPRRLGVNVHSPSTPATIIASVVCTAEFARGRKDKHATDFLLDYADWLSSHLEEWTVTNRGELVKGKLRHYVRIPPTAARVYGRMRLR